jgi:hypothetical protein
MLHYILPTSNTHQRLKIEASFRRANDISEYEVTVTSGVRIYTIERLAPLKKGAFLDDRILGRDVFDTSFLLARYPNTNPDQQLVSIDARLTELGEDGLLELMADDEILRSHDLGRVTLEMGDAVRRLRAAQNLLFLPSGPNSRRTHSPSFLLGAERTTKVIRPIPSAFLDRVI